MNDPVSIYTLAYIWLAQLTYELGQTFICAKIHGNVLMMAWQSKWLHNYTLCTWLVRISQNSWDPMSSRDWLVSSIIHLLSEFKLIDNEQWKLSGEMQSMLKMIDIPFWLVACLHVSLMHINLQFSYVYRV